MTKIVDERQPRASGWLNRRQAARLAGVHPATLRKLEASGLGPPFYRVSAKVQRYRLDEFTKWLEARRVAPGAP